ncbi:branched-chain amino acid ABC transporter permease [Hoeflea poritis]|uniref:Branched-chain amino acid ABC transporter permease n=1 Tax=Hoeflea poritis TaxID=2993659 RepID=A0ABT4VVE0_9HYPH|nr:branched-chain amino acid ABC transporter permease [Hoeflea poritis]MDA4848691.1 branched-chain amino acid ABC transporter permease [Hoeflea poritis]
MTTTILNTTPGQITRKQKLGPASIIAIGIILALLILPAFVQGYTLTSYRDVLLFALFALSLDLFWGKTGILSFGHATFFGLGAYGMAIMSIHFSIDPAIVSLVGLLAGVGMAALVALIVGYFILYGGVRGAYFTIVTLALTLIANHVAVGWPSVTGGDSGLIGVPPFSILGWSFADPISSYYLALIVLGACLLSSMWVMSGRLGLILTAIQDDEIKVQTLGYKTPLLLLMTFAASAAMAALAGGLYAAGNGFVAPDMIALLLSTEVIIWVAVGGSGTLVGAVIGTAIVWWLQQKISSINASAWPIVIGTFFILLVLVFPKGPAAFVLDKVKKLRRDKEDDR